MDFFLVSERNRGTYAAVIKSDYHLLCSDGKAGLSTAESN